MIQENKSKKVLKKGLLIAIEGIDGAGKTTYAELLRNVLHKDGYSVTLLHEPTEGKWGKKIAELAMKGLDDINPETEFELFCKDRREDVENNIKPALKRRDIVIMDRYYLSNIAYQGARGLDADFIEKENIFAPKPDLVIILDLPPKTALSRIKDRASKLSLFEKEQYLIKVREIFKKRFSERPYVKIIDGEQPVHVVSEKIREFLQPLIEKLEESP
ncbi:MAG: dTMP kinase [Candidatus Methylarchaceae archaeon HK01B]|nr:dTMP kinase [Candidatus Methylarchaceae archaeon HK01B]